MAEPSEALERKFELLWGDRSAPSAPTRGRPASSSVDEVVDAALLIAREAGLEKVSMRRVAAAVGMGTMTLYNYVPSREVLLELMIDRAYSTMTLPTPDMEWRPALEQYAHEHYRMYMRNNWLLQTSMMRAPLAPAVLDAGESGLRTLIDTGLSEAEVFEVINFVDTMVQGVARWDIVEQRDERETGLTTYDYWARQSSFWEKWFDVERYPTMTRVYMAGGFDQGGGFASTVESLLDNIEQAIAKVQR